jgi:hypothetical protein
LRTVAIEAAKYERENGLQRKNNFKAISHLCRASLGAGVLIGHGVMPFV